jgi:hypothetical protein
METTVWKWRPAYDAVIERRKKMKWDWTPIKEFVKTEHNFDVDEFVTDPLQPLKEILGILQTRYNFDWEKFKADPDAYAKRLSKAAEAALQANPVVEIVDGMALDAVCIGGCRWLATWLATLID